MMYRLIISLFLIINLSVLAQNTANNWPMYRGRADLSGWTEATISSSPTLLWTLKTNSRSVSSPVVKDGIIYFGNNEGEIHAVNLKGEILWKYDIESAIEAAPLIIDNKVVFGALDGELRALDTKTGKLIWQYKTENQIIGSANIWDDSGEKFVVVGSYDYNLHCVNPETGKAIWIIETDNFINGSPAIFHNKIVFGGCGGYLRVADARSGLERNKSDLGVYLAGSPAIASNKAFVGDYEGNFFGINLSSMEVEWKSEQQSDLSVLLATPAIGNLKVVVGSEDKYLYCYNMNTGDVEWKFRTDGRITSSAVISNDKVLVGSRDGNIYIVNLNTGEKIWSFDTGKPISSTAAVIENKFFVLTEDGRLLAFGKGN